MSTRLSPTRQRLLDEIRVVLAGRRVVTLAVAIAALLGLPVLFQGLQADDHVLRGFLLRTPPWDRWAPAPLDLFRFYDGNVARSHSLIDSGFSPWWSDPEISVMFFRPLSAFTHWVDFHLWPSAPALMHAQSLAWYLALVAAAGSLYRRLLGPGWVAGFAAVIYAVDHTHGTVFEWLSGRNALVAGTFAVLALLFHDRARSERRVILSLASAGCLALALAGGEVGLGAVGYLAAHVLFLDRDSLRARIVAVAPHLAVLVAWIVVYRTLGYGARGSGLYVDPTGTPFAFLRAVAAHLPLLLQIELGGFPPDILVFFQHVPPAFYAGSALLIGASFAAFWPLRSRPLARFFFTGAILSTVLVCGVFPAGRMMLLPGLGLLGLVAQVVEGMADGTLAWRPGPARAAAVFVAVWVGWGHLFLSPLVALWSSQELAVLERVVTQFSDSIGDDPALDRQRLVIVNSPDPFFSYYIRSQRISRGRVAPERMLVLASGRQGMEVTRLDERSLRVESDGGFYGAGTSVLTRSVANPVPAGTRFSYTGVRVEVTRSSPEGVAEEAIFHFDEPLEGVGLRWVEWKGRAFVPFVFPPVGEARRIDAQIPDPLGALW
jgi:hypothetical protein